MVNHTTITPEEATTVTATALGLSHETTATTTEKLTTETTTTLLDSVTNAEDSEDSEDDYYDGDWDVKM